MHINDLPWWAVLLIILAALITAKYLFHLDAMLLFHTWTGRTGVIN
ncbi:MAG: hypothetical protein KHW89_01305 [Roseburia sp.]|nr:hypothetical protein [Roseburia sp.]